MSEQGLLRRAQRQADGRLVQITPESAGWAYISFAAYRLGAGERLCQQTEDRETALIVLGGRCSVVVTAEGLSHRFDSIGERETVWERQRPYVLLLPPGHGYELAAEGELHLAIAGAPTPAGGEVRLIRPDQITTEHRGEGQTARFIQHLLPPAAEAARLILVEVYTPGGNWSSFPPHKHDTETPPRESYLEEIYYYQIQPESGFALQRLYTPDRSLDLTLAPGQDDVTLVPRGYHPVAATPGHDCYYLNVMAGPTRAWNFQVDPDYQHLMNWQKPPVARED
ncbi:MAG TPA: 5-deoxy-glucuronate isomerase [Symbiobacteriaceae bacterium]|nr:5-deoxy-glucuronate isomerase [Symbiobacteriaceae bacterium]